MTRVQLSGCPGIDAQQLLADVVNSGARLAEVSTDNRDMTGNSSTLEAMQRLGTRGIGSEHANVCDGMNGTWTFSNLVEASTFASLRAYFPNLTLYNAQYTMIELDDDEENGYDAAIRNLDNGTKDGVGEGYVPSGHIARLQSMLHVCKGTYDESTKKMRLEKISDGDMYRLENGKPCDLTDANGLGYDIFLCLPHYWYKGINDHIRQKKYTAFSTEASAPRSTASKIVRKPLGSILLKSFSCVPASRFRAGDAFGAGDLAASSASNVYSLDVVGMRQVRWPGVSSDVAGGVFLDADGKVSGTVCPHITNANSDFIAGEYVFAAVPTGSCRFVFTSPVGQDLQECIAVDSSAIEAIEPDWVEHNLELIGVYKGSVDNLNRLRSVSGAVPQGGTGTPSTWAGWGYDADGNVTNGLPPTGTKLNFTCKDFQNLAQCRGKGYQLVDYEMHKDIANLWMATHGRRNSQAVNGTGGGVGVRTGGSDAASRPPLYETESGRPRTLGLEDWWCNVYELMDNVAVNVPSFAAYKKNRGQVPGGSVVDEVWRIRMADGTERAVQGISDSGQEICRVRHGRFCDVVPSKCVTNGSMNTYYADVYQYEKVTARCVFRSGEYALAQNGFVRVLVSKDASFSAAYYSSRLAFRGECEFVE